MRRGFTILELIIYMAILSLVTVVLADTYISLLGGRGQAETRAIVNTNLRAAFDRIERDVKAANEITTPVLPGATSSTLVLASSDGAITYDVFSGRLRRATTSAEFMTGPDVSVVSFTALRVANFQPVLHATTTGVHVTLSLRSTSTSAFSSYTNTLQTTILLR